jgi:hypothetical protein
MRLLLQVRIHSRPAINVLKLRSTALRESFRSICPAFVILPSASFVVYNFLRESAAAGISFPLAAEGIYYFSSKFTKVYATSTLQTLYHEGSYLQIHLGNLLLHYHTSCHNDSSSQNTLRVSIVRWIYPQCFCCSWKNTICISKLPFRCRMVLSTLCNALQIIKPRCTFWSWQMVRESHRLLLPSVGLGRGAGILASACISSLPYP